MRLGQYRIMLFGLLFVACLVVSAYAEDSGKPMAFVEEPVYRFDSVIEGQDIVHEFTIRNNGTADLRIEKVASG